MSEELLEKPRFKWSFSQWETYDTCPAKWKFRFINRFPQKPPGVAASRGLSIHDSVQKYIQGDPESVLHPAINKKYIPILDEFKNHNNGDRHCEKKLAFDGEWSICAPTSQFAACVAVLDAVRYDRKRIRDDNDVPTLEGGVLYIGEWKSGKPKDRHPDQRKLYAMFGMRAWPSERVEVTTYYLEDTAPPARTVVKTEAGFETLKALWTDRIRTMQRDEMCAPRPGYYCDFCDFSKAVGGPCIF